MLAELIPLIRTSANYPDGNGPPCVCNNQLDLRQKKLQCPSKPFVFSKPTDPEDGTQEQAAISKPATDIT